MPKYISLLFLLLCINAQSYCKGGKPITIAFHPNFAGEPVDTDGAFYRLATGDSITLETFKCYISSIQLYKNGSRIYEEQNSYHLLSTDDKNSLRFTLTNAPSQYDMLVFCMGIDSMKNVSGAFGGDLDPANGMYWAWQSGYINVKIDGRSNLCDTRNNSFQFHLGGYAKDLKAIQRIALEIQPQEEIAVAIQLDRFLNNIDLAKQNEIMIPGREAVSLSEKLAKVFEIVQP